MFPPHKFFSRTFDDLQKSHNHFHRQCAAQFRRNMYHHWHRGPSRILWFALGAATTAMYLKHKDSDGQHRAWRHCANARIPQGAYSQNAPPAGQQPGQPDWQQKKWEYWGWSPHRPVIDPQASVTTPPPVSAAATTPGRLPDTVEDERQLQKIAHQATETLADLSEAGLDSLMTTVENLKARVVQRRLQREQELAELQAHREKELAKLQAQHDEKYKQFEEWKKQQDALKEEEAKRPRHLV